METKGQKRRTSSAPAKGRTAFANSRPMFFLERPKFDQFDHPTQNVMDSMDQNGQQVLRCQFGWSGWSFSMFVMN